MKKKYKTATGKELSDQDIQEISDTLPDEKFDVDAIRRRGRPSLGKGPAQLVPVRIDPDLMAKVRERVTADDSTTSQVVRDALAQYLAS